MTRVAQSGILWLIRGDTVKGAGFAMPNYERTEDVEVGCPFCPGKLHSYPLAVKYSRALFFRAPDNWPPASRPFVRIFKCPDTQRNFEAEVTVSQASGETVAEVAVKPPEGDPET
jgi:hypothetical protein